MLLPFNTKALIQIILANGTFLPKQEMNQSSEISGRIVSVLVKRRF